MKKKMKLRIFITSVILLAVALVSVYYLCYATTTTKTAEEFYDVVGEGRMAGEDVLRINDWIPREILAYTPPYEDPPSYPGNVSQMILIEKITKHKIYVKEVEWNGHDSNEPGGFSYAETGVEKEYLYDADIEIWMNANIYQYRISMKELQKCIRETEWGVGPYRYIVRDGKLKGIYEQYLP